MAGTCVCFSLKFCNDCFLFSINKRLGMTVTNQLNSALCSLYLNTKFCVFFFVLSTVDLVLCSFFFVNKNKSLFFILLQRLHHNVYV
jgi:hypothetical protein